VGTAGSTTLVLQTILLPLLTAGGMSRIVLEGGTHNPFAPPFDFLAWTFLPILKRMGADVAVDLARPGFYPAGGGRFTATVNPVAGLSRIDLMERGPILTQQAVAVVSQLPRAVGGRELAVLKDKLAWADEAMSVVEVKHPHGPGNVLMATLESARVTEVFTAFGERGLPAERVAAGVVKPVREYLAAGVPVGRYLADQLMIPMALAGGGEFMTLPLSRHSTTNIEVLKRFLDVDVAVAKRERLKWHVAMESK